MIRISILTSCLALFMLACGGNEQQAPEVEASLKTDTLTTTAPKVEHTSPIDLQATLDAWIQLQLADKKLLSKDICHPEYVFEHEELLGTMGLDTVNALQMSDLNGDGHQEAFFTYEIMSCDGSNAIWHTTEYGLIANDGQKQQVFPSNEWMVTTADDTTPKSLDERFGMVVFDAIKGDELVLLQMIWTGQGDSRFPDQSQRHYFTYKGDKLIHLLRSDAPMDSDL